MTNRKNQQQDRRVIIVGEPSPEAIAAFWQMYNDTLTPEDVAHECAAAPDCVEVELVEERITAL